MHESRTFNQVLDERSPYIPRLISQNYDHERSTFCEQNVMIIVYKSHCFIPEHNDLLWGCVVTMGYLSTIHPTCITEDSTNQGISMRIVV